MAWEDLLAITKEARALRDEDANRAPTACPIDGEPLRQGPGGQLYCPFDGWKPGDPATA